MLADDITISSQRRTKAEEKLKEVKACAGKLTKIGLSTTEYMHTNDSGASGTLKGVEEKKVEDVKFLGSITTLGVERRD